MSTQKTNGPVFELRVALTTADYERMVWFYRKGLGLEPAEIWTDEEGQALIFEMGRAMLEIFDELHAAAVDEIEAGQAHQRAYPFRA